MADFINKMQDVVWTSPSGKVFTLKTLESGYSRKHLGEVKENPKTTYTTTTTKGKGNHTSTSTGKKKIGDSNDTFSDLGIGGKDVALDFLFIGENHDIDSEIFTDALCEIGKSKLKLVYGSEFTVNVINFSVKNTLLQQINKTTVSVNFHQTTESSYPESASSSAKQVQSAAEDANAISAQNLETTAASAAKEQSRADKFLKSYNSMLSKVNGALSALNVASINSILADIAGQNVLSNAYTMTSQLQIAMSQTVGLFNSVENLGNKFVLPNKITSAKNTLANLMESLKTPGTTSPLTIQQIDALKINDTTAQAIISAYAQNITQSEYITRKEAIDAVNEFTSIADGWNEYLEDEYKKIDNLADAFVRDSDINGVALAAVNAVIEKSYELKVEKTLFLTEDESILNIAYSNYKREFKADPDNTVKYLIDSNGWGDDYFYLVPKGTGVKLYV